MKILKKFLLTFFAVICITKNVFALPPKITLVIVVDQLSYQTFERLSPYFKYGFKKLIENGTNFTNAHHPHGNPVTATGHATISTGAYAKDHGIVLNEWMKDDGSWTSFGEDDAKTAGVFSKNGLYDYGISARQLLVPTLADKIMLANNADKNYSVYAIANKPGPAVAMAGKLGKAIWFDERGKQYTSSKAYFEKLPAWLNKFNHIKNRSNNWNLCYNKNSPAYQFPFIRDYRFAAKKDRTNKFPYEQTPIANQALVQLGKTCIDISDLQKKSNHLVLLISFSNLDTIGHLYGQNSIEATDLLYHLDRQLDTLITYAQKKGGQKQTLVILTADHGCCPIVEQIKAQGFYAARRLNANQLKDMANKIINKKHSLENIITKIENTQVFFNKKIMRTLEKSEQESITKTIKNFMGSHPAIKHCWTKKELLTQNFDKHNLEQYYKNQLHPDRSGDLILMPYPYTYISSYPKGTGHTCAYAYDTQVPLIFYQNGVLEKSKNAHTVYLTQLAPILATMLNVPFPEETPRLKFKNKQTIEFSKSF